MANAVIEAAASEKKGRFEHELNLCCVPLKHDLDENIKMSWFQPGRTQPFEFWVYEEHIDFQKEARKHKMVIERKMSEKIQKKK